MGKSPGKWMKTVLFGKKSSKSSLSKDATLDKKTSITLDPQSNNLGADSTVISTPVCHVNNLNGEHTPLEKSYTANLINAAKDDELIRLEQAATKAQAAFRGYLARRAFWALKGIIRLQAVIRGHLVRRQAVATLHCMRAIIGFQAIVRGQIVRLSGSCPQSLQKGTPGEHVQKEQADLLQMSLKSEKLSTNAFAVKLVASSKTTVPLNIDYDPTEPNSVTNWLSRWSSSHFWDPLPPPPKKRKPIKSQSKIPKTLKNNSLNSPDSKINMESNGKENDKARRRKSFPVKQELHVPSYMAATESAKAKLRSQAAARAVEDGSEIGFLRRHSLPSSTIATGKLGLQLPHSPRVQKPLLVNTKGGSKTNKSQISPKDEGWRR